MRKIAVSAIAAASLSLSALTIVGADSALAAESPLVGQVTTLPLSGSDDAATAVSDPIFRWNKVFGASYYTITISRDAAFTNLLVNKQKVYGTAFALQESLLNGQYYWYVVANDANGDPGLASDVRTSMIRWGAQDGRNKTGGPSDDTAPVPLSGYTTLAAAQSNPISESDFIFSWQPLARTTKYAATVTPISTSISPFSVRNFNVSNTSFTSVGSASVVTNPQLATLDSYTELEPGDWKVTIRGINDSADGTNSNGTVYSGVSEERYFTIAADHTTHSSWTGQTALDTAAWASDADRSTAPSPTMKWAAVDGAEGYEIRVYRGTGVTNLVSTFVTGMTSASDGHYSLSTTFRPPAVFDVDNTGQSYYWKVLPFYYSTGGRWYMDSTSVDTLSGDWQDATYLSWTRILHPTQFNATSVDQSTGLTTLSWTPQSITGTNDGGSRGYELQYRIKGSDGNWTAAASNHVLAEYPFWITQKGDTPLANGTYEARVRPLDSYGNPQADWSTIQQFDVYLRRLPTSATPAAKSNGRGRVDLTWSDLTGDARGVPLTEPVSYKVRYRPTDLLSGTDWIQIGAANGLSYSAAGLKDATEYEFQLAAVNSEGQGKWSTSKKLTTEQVPPTAPHSVHLSVASKSIKILWTYPDAAGSKPVTGYIVERRTGGKGAWSTIATVTGLSLTDAKVADGTRYDYRVSAKSAVGKSVPSPVVGVTKGAPTGSKISKLSAKKGSITVKPGGAKKVGAVITSYKLQYSVDGVHWKSLKAVKPGKSLTTRVGKKGRRVYFRSAAKNKFGTSPYGAVRSIIKK